MPELCGTTPEERGTVNMLRAILKDLKLALAGPCYNDATEKEGYTKEQLPKLEPIDEFL